MDREKVLQKIEAAWQELTESYAGIPEAQMTEPGVRRVITRSGVVFSPRGGVLAYLALPFRFFVGGRLGHGRQWISWIHLADEIGAIRFLIENDKARGPFNLTSPHPITNAEMSRDIGKVLHRPAFVPVPGFAMRLALGELAQLLLLGGQRVVPQRLQQMGYAFQFAEPEPALRNLLAGHA